MTPMFDAGDNVGMVRSLHACRIPAAASDEASHYNLMPNLSPKCSLDDDDCRPQVLSPQYNSNLSRTNDIFNHSNLHFWQ